MSAAGRNGNADNRAAFDFYPTDPRYTRAILIAIDSGASVPGSERRSLYQCPCEVCSRGALRPLPGGTWCDPCAGDLSIVRAVEDYYTARSPVSGMGGPSDWMTVDIRPESPADRCADFLSPGVAEGADLYFTNPPYGTDDGEEPFSDLIMKCQRCGVEPGIPCVGARGTALKTAHVERHRAAREIADAAASNAFNFVRLQVERMNKGGSVLNLIRFGFFTARERVEWNRAHRADIWPMAPRPSFGLNAKGKKGTDATDYVWARWGEGVTGAHHAPIDWRLV